MDDEFYSLTKKKTESIFRNITEIVKKIKSLHGIEGCGHKITDVWVDL